jgi:glycerol-3-phosphate dehydrogenase
MAGFRNLQVKSGSLYDLLVIGGGINGAGIAADASGRGLSVVLIDSGDWGHATSSASTKLIHGGLRYLETWQFRLVRESLHERKTLLHAAPHLVRPLEFHLVHSPEMRPFWMIWLGMKLYDGLAGANVLPKSKTLRFSPQHSPLQPKYKKGFSYADCKVDDARLVLENVIQATSRGAVAASRTRCTGMMPLPDNAGWQVELTCQLSGDKTYVETRCVVNAAGPWADQVDGLANLPESHKTHLRLVKGSHIVVPALYEGEQAYLLQLKDGRIIFTIPYQGRFTLIGTTDEEITGDPADSRVSDAEVSYLCEAVSSYFGQPVSAKDVVWQFAGVRPLEQTADTGENASQASRDYKLELSSSPAPLLSVYGGKLTSYRALADATMTKLENVFPTLGPTWTRDAKLPGAPSNETEMPVIRESLLAALSEVQADIIDRWLGSYGKRAIKLLDYAQSAPGNQLDAGPLMGPGLYKVELDFLLNEEWAETVDDVIWRRTKLGLLWSTEDIHALNDYLLNR